MPQRWIVFADDAGDPGATSRGDHFGYTVIAFARDDMRTLTEGRARLRMELGEFGEAKRGNVRATGFQRVVSQARAHVQSGAALVAASFILKSKYRGYWLEAKDDKPADPTMLRNYVLRKALELLFDGVEYGEQDTLELVVDRVDYSDAQIANLRDYLAGKFNQHGLFQFPRVTHATHADSIYVEGLQLADHIARLAHRIVSRPDEGVGLGGHDFLRIETVLESRDFVLNPEAERAFSRRVRASNEQQKAGAGGRIQATRSRILARLWATLGRTHL